VGTSGPGNAPTSEEIDSRTNFVTRVYGLEAARVHDIIRRTATVVGLSPDLREACEFMPPDEAIALFEESDLKKLAELEVFVRYLNAPCAAFCSLSELPTILESFAAYLEDSREHILSGGFSPRTFRPEWPDLMLGNLYFTEYPMELVELQSELTKLPGNLRILQQGPALSAAQIERVNELRPALLQLKVDVIRQLARSTATKDEERIWSGCLEVMVDGIDAEDLDFWLDIDRLYPTSQPGSGSTHRLACGGISSLFNLIGSIEEEIKIGTMDKTFAACEDILRPYDGGWALVAESYYQFVAHSYPEVIDFIYQVFQACELLQQDFWVHYKRRVNKALLDEFCTTVEVKRRMKRSVAREYNPVVASYADHVLSCLNSRSDVSGMLLLDGPVSEHQPAAADQKESENERRSHPRVQDVAPFPTPVGATWADVSIELVNDEVVKIKVGNKIDHKHFEQMGFRDHRTPTSKPDKLWEYLKVLARCEGEIAWATEAEVADIRLHKKHVSDLRKRLQAHFGIEGDPFESYRQKRAYKAKFTIVDSREASR
jgi:hypothetical protein